MMEVKVEDSKVDDVPATSAHEESFPEDEEDLDPRIQVELEKLNSSTDVINKLELDLEEARSTFRHLLNESGHHLNRLQKEIGPSVEKARPYYEARMKARLALAEAQHAAARFEKASSGHEAAKEMVTLAEEGFKERGVENFDPAWQEMLNHATTRVNESEVERNSSEEEHLVKSRTYQEAEKRVQMLQKSLKRSINKSRPYFEAKAKLNQSLDDQKKQIQVIEETIQMTKAGYAESLKELERISEEIHERRKQKAKHNDSTDGLGTRVAGVGAEFPSPSPMEKKLKTLQRQFSASAAVIHSENLRSRRSSVSSSSTEGHDDNALCSILSSSSSSPAKALDTSARLTSTPKVTNKHLLNVTADDDGSSDAESLASLDVMDDTHIDFLMKDVSIQEAALKVDENKESGKPAQD